MKLAESSTGDVRLVTGMTLAEISNYFTCIDIDEAKIEKMKSRISPIYEPSLSELMRKKLEVGRLSFTSKHKEGFNEAEVIYNAVETPENEDGSANLSCVEDVATTIALTAKKDTIVVTKSTVPVGTNDRLLQIIDHNKLYHINIEVVSNPELLEVCASYAYIRNEEAAFVLTEFEKSHLQASLGSW